MVFYFKEVISKQKTNCIKGTTFSPHEFDLFDLSNQIHSTQNTKLNHEEAIHTTQAHRTWKC